MSFLPKIIAVTGPTASGKSTLGVKLAEKINGEIVSADSMQIYKFMDIGTAKPTEAEKCGILHHMLDIIPPTESYSVARYIKDAYACINNILSRNKTPILVGGTGLYIDSLISGRTFSARGDEKLRKELEDEFDNLGGEHMLNKLSEFDPQRASLLHVNDKKRIVRAIESYLTTGKTISLHDEETKSLSSPYTIVKAALNFSDRNVLYDRINLRVDIMMENGFLSEVEKLLKSGVTSDNTSMQAIGYKELSDVIINKTDLSSAVEKIKMESRRYAKRQLTWLRRDKNTTWINRDKIPDYDKDILVLMELLS